MTGQGTVNGVVHSTEAGLPKAEPGVAGADSSLVSRFRHSQERGAKFAADAGIEVDAIPALVRKERTEMSPEDDAEAEAILMKSVTDRPHCC